MSASTAATKPKIVLKPFPTMAELDAMYERFNASHNEFQATANHFRNVFGYISSEHWEGRLEQPPSLEDIGALTVYLDNMEMMLGVYAGEVAELKSVATANLDSLRLDQHIRIDMPADGIRLGDDDAS